VEGKEQRHIKVSAQCQADVNKQITGATCNESCCCGREEDGYLSELTAEVSTTQQSSEYWTDDDEDNVG
jgi:hypothetical protein